MRAARIHEFGPPQVIALESLEVPTPASGEVLVRVHASGVGPWDALVRSGRSALGHSLPLTLGSEVCGTVEVIGGLNGATWLQPGDQVYGATNALFVGGYADHAICGADMLAAKPKQLTAAEAASLPVAGVMAWQMVTQHANVQRDQLVVVQGAAGNVGAFAVQIARSLRARVIGTVQSPEDTSPVRELGAEAVTSDPASLARFASTADAVIDTVGGASQSALFGLLKPHGVMVSAVSVPDPALAARAQVRADYFVTRVDTASLEAISALLAAGALKTHVGATLPLEEVRVAHEMLAGMRPRPGGKIVLSVA